MKFDIVNITRPELAVALYTQRTLLQELEFIDKCSKRDGCKACIHFAVSTNTCSKHAAQVPPAYVKDGCDDWQFDAIPF